ncbi:division plane positioning ATPase MipZ [Gemmatimonas sp.]|jgi:chromosome partitioning protein|uniref:division plane positioning ATPase MipZ n=1 Tax=Gemmatimonas sp. TaxID=1962908 RepID=UPI0027B974CB|nr:division plane positioning ATPase MipZ [Gemmatimonas sp.]
MILTFGHTKGGVGKSMLALNVAVERIRAGVDTLLIDGDPRQTSVSKAIAVRSESGQEPPVPCIVLEDARTLRQQVGLLRPKYQDLVIDVGGKDSSALRSALLVTDVLVLPVAPESVELWAIDDVVEVIEEAQALHPFQVLVVLNRAKSSGRDNADTRAMVAEYPQLTMLAPSIGHRSVFSSAFGRGLSVAEYRPANAKAISELRAVLAALYS